MRTPCDHSGRPFYSPIGRSKTFDEHDLYRMREAMREEEQQRLAPRQSRRAQPYRPQQHQDSLAELLALIDERKAAAKAKRKAERGP